MNGSGSVHSSAADESESSERGNGNDNMDSFLVESTAITCSNGSNDEIVGSGIDQQQVTQHHHYHIYMVHPSDGDFDYYRDRSRRKSSCWCSTWLILSVLALLTNLVYLYGPPAPPPPPLPHVMDDSITWSDFLSEQWEMARALAFTWGHKVPSHVASWCWKGMKEDIIETWGQRGTKSNKECQLDIDALCSMLRDSIVGQNHAVEGICNKIRIDWATEPTLQSTPTLFYLTGRTGTGKTHLTQTFISLLEGNGCSIEAWTTSTNEFESIEAFHDGLIHRHNSMNDLSGMQHRVVVVDNFEEWSGESLQHLMADIGRQGFGRTVFFLISHVGSRIIDRAIQKYGRDVPVGEVQAYLKYEVNQHHRGATDDFTMTKYVDSVEAFLPLDQSSLGEVLKKKVAEQVQDLASEFRITDAAAESVLESSIEFELWIDRITGQTLYKMSPEGASPLKDIALRLSGRLRRCFGESASNGNTNLSVPYMVMDQRSQHDINTFVVFSCPGSELDVSGCHEICNFRSL